MAALALEAGVSTCGVCDWGILWGVVFGARLGAPLAWFGKRRGSIRHGGSVRRVVSRPLAVKGWNHFFAQW